MRSSPVSVFVENGVSLLLIDNPPVNALSTSVLHELLRVLRIAADDPSTRAIVLAASGPTYIAGADLGELQEILGNPTRARTHFANTDALFEQMSRQPQPIVAAVHAPALGGGFEVALACDLIIMDTQAFFQLPELGLALMPGAGGTQRLMQRIGRQRATTAVLLCRRISAAEANDWGIASLAASGQAMNEAMRIAGELAAQPAIALRSALLALRHRAEADLASGLRLEQAYFLQLLEGEEARRGVAEFFASRRERRDPDAG